MREFFDLYFYIQKPKEKSERGSFLLPRRGKIKQADGCAVL